MGLSQQMIDLLEDKKKLADVKAWVDAYGYRAAERKFGLSRYIITQALKSN